MIDPKTLRVSCAGLTVLYVEDEEEIRNHVASILANFFAEVRSAADGEQGLAAFRERAADLVVSDIKMPHMGGLEMLKAIKEINREQAVLIVSAYNEARFFAEAIRLGVNGFVLKPVEMQQLFETLQRIVGSIREHRENKLYRDHLERLVREKTEELAKRLVTDDLTGLFNHLQLQDDLSGDEPVALVLINVDNLRELNDGYGFHIGNWALQALAAGLWGERSPGARLYRLASDFVVTLPGADLAYGEAEARRLHRYVSDLHLTTEGGADVVLASTFGVVAGRGPGLIDQARLAVMEARQQGNNRIFVLRGRSTLEGRQRETMERIAQVHRALADGRIVAHFQPIVNNATGRIAKYEALARMIDEKGELIPPLQFIQAAKLGGLMPSLTECMFDQAIALLGRCRCEISVNVTDVELRDGSLSAYLEGMLRDLRFDPGRLVIEVLEGISIDDSPEAMDQLRHLKALGLKLAIDDFGAEHSHFSRLMDLDADYLKIDGQFIKNIDHDPKACTISRAITELAKTMNIRVIAEFVHSREVQKKVLELGIHYSQGFYLGEPSPEPAHDCQEGPSED